MALDKLGQPQIYELPNMISDELKMNYYEQRHNGRKAEK